MLCLCIVTKGLSTESSQVQFQEFNLLEGQRQAAQEGKLLFVQFSANWCMPCQWMDEHTFADPFVIDYMQEHFIPIRLDIDFRLGQTYQNQYDVKLIPTFLIFNTQGKLVGRHESSFSSESLIEVLEKYNLPENKARIFGLSGMPITPGGFSRPALIPSSDNATTNVATVSYNENKIQELPGQYGIQVGVFSSYEKVIREVLYLEKRCDKEVNLFIGQANGKTIYRVIIGQFPNQKGAYQYMRFLERRMIYGFVKNIASL